MLSLADKPRPAKDKPKTTSQIKKPALIKPAALQTKLRLLVSILSRRGIFEFIQSN